MHERAWPADFTPVLHHCSHPSLNPREIHLKLRKVNLNMRKSQSVFRDGGHLTKQPFTKRQIKQIKSHQLDQIELI